MYNLVKDRQESLFAKEEKLSEAVLEDRRIVEIFLVDSWHRAYFREIKEGDKFRLFDPKSKEPIKNSLGETEFIADTDAYLAKHKELKKFVYHVQIKEKDALHKTE